MTVETRRKARQKGKIRQFLKFGFNARMTCPYCRMRFYIDTDRETRVECPRCGKRVDLVRWGVLIRPMGGGGQNSGDLAF